MRLLNGFKILRNIFEKIKSLLTVENGHNSVAGLAVFRHIIDGFLRPHITVDMTWITDGTSETKQASKQQDSVDKPGLKQEKKVTSDGRDFIGCTHHLLIKMQEQ